MGRTLLEILLSARTRWWAEENDEAPTPLFLFWRASMRRSSASEDKQMTTIRNFGSLMLL